MIKGYFISLSCSNETNRKMSYGTWGNESTIDREIFALDNFRVLFSPPGKVAKIL